MVALVAAAEWLDGTDRAYALALADCWNERIEEWTYVEDTDLARAHGVRGYYVRIAPPEAEGGLCGRIRVQNREGETVPAAALVGLEFLSLARLGLRRADDPRLTDTLGSSTRCCASRRRAALPTTVIPTTATASTRTEAPSTAMVSAAPGRCSPASVVTPSSCSAATRSPTSRRWRE